MGLSIELGGCELCGHDNSYLKLPVCHILYTCEGFKVCLRCLGPSENGVHMVLRYFYGGAKLIYMSRVCTHG